jgi:hypothetical protein
VVIETNPARGRRRKLKLAKRKGNSLEADEIGDLVEAAGQLDQPLSNARIEQLAAEIVQLRDGAKLARKAIAARVGISLGGGGRRSRRQGCAFSAPSGRAEWRTRSSSAIPVTAS